MFGYYTNNKNGDLYFVEKTVINCTNEVDGQIMVLYYKVVKNDNIPDWDNSFVMSVEEFNEKFTKYNVDC